VSRVRQEHTHPRNNNGRRSRGVHPISAAAVAAVVVAAEHRPPRRIGRRARSNTTRTCHTLLTYALRTGRPLSNSQYIFIDIIDFSRASTMLRAAALFCSRSRALPPLIFAQVIAQIYERPLARSRAVTVICMAIQLHG